MGRPFACLLHPSEQICALRAGSSSVCTRTRPRYRVQVARQAVADVVEARHRGAGHDDYQFRLSNSVVDATVAGGMARYINHSCAPNCVTRQCAVDGTLHIGIFAGRHVTAGEELCYDYKVRNSALPVFMSVRPIQLRSKVTQVQHRVRACNLLCTRKCEASYARTPRVTQLKSPSFSPLT